MSTSSSISVHSYLLFTEDAKEREDLGRNPHKHGSPLHADWFCDVPGLRVKVNRGGVRLGKQSEATPGYANRNMLTQP